jgi:hypothetical protein
MTSVSVTTPVNPTVKPPPRREIREWTDFDRLLTSKGDSTKASTIIALLLTLLFHASLVLLAPWALSEKKKTPLPPPAPEYAVQAMTPEDLRFVEANPDAPVAPKQDTPNIADRNQQAAQQNPDLTSNSDTPNVKGEQNETMKIVTGDTRPKEAAAPPPQPASRQTPATKPTPPTPPQPQQPPNPTQPAKQAVQPEQQKPSPPVPNPAKQPAEQPPPKPAPAQGPTQPAPPPPTAQQTYQGTPQPNATPGEGVAVAEKPVESTATKPVDSKSLLPTETEKPNESKTTAPSKQEQTPPPPPPEEAKPSPLATVQVTQPTPPQPATQPAPDSQPSDNQPMARRQVKQHVPAGLLTNNPTNARNVGQTAIQSNFSQFGNYEQRMWEAISSAWYQLADKMDLGSAVGTYVVVVFTLNQQGEVIECQAVKSTSPTPATYICTEAVQSVSPFGPWPEDAKKMLGETQNVRVTFWYR